MTLEADDIRRGLQEGLHDNRVVPVLCGATEWLGLTSLTNFISNNFPHLGSIVTPSSPMMGTRASSHHRRGTAAALVFKTTIDQFSGKLSFVRCCAAPGRGRPSYNAIVSRKERANKVYRMVGKKLVETSALTPAMSV